MTSGRAISSLLVLVGLAAHAETGRHMAQAKRYGNFEFRDVSIHRSILGSGSCVITGEIENQTDGSWTGARFSFTILGEAKGQSTTYEVALDYLAIGASDNFSKYCYRDGRIADYPNYEPDSFLIDFIDGAREPGPEAAKREAAAARSASIAAAKARIQALAKFPTLESGFSSAFVGSHKKCSAQFLEATAMEGLEKRKRLADLISFGCGFTAGNSNHVTVGSKDGNFAVVTLMEGPHSGRSGWVPSSWIKPAIPTSR